MLTRTLRGRVAVAGIGETVYYKHGRSPDAEFALALQAILRACEDAGISPREVDGFASYSNDRNDPSRLGAALGLPELRFSNMQWGGGGGGGAAAVGNAAAAVATGTICAACPSTSSGSRRARSTATARPYTTRRSTAPRASPRSRRTCTPWPAWDRPTST